MSELTDLKISEVKITDVINGYFTKEGQYFQLWMAYTAVKFAEGTFGSSSGQLSLHTAGWIIAGVWLFNAGHLYFIIDCLRVMKSLQSGIQGLAQKLPESNFKQASIAISGGELDVAKKDQRKFISYTGNILTHLLIDCCATAAILSRIYS
jgi:hypothetical protein